MARVMTMSIRTEPIVGADAEKVGVDRYDLAVQFRKLVQPYTNSCECFLGGLHLCKPARSLARVE